MFSLTDDWTNDRNKWISLNFMFIEQIIHEKFECRIAVVVSRRCSFCWVLNDVGVTENLKTRLSISLW